jgi:Domain of unknown function (DUF4105)
LSEQRSSYGQHRCVTHFKGIPLFIFNYALDISVGCAILFAIFNLKNIVKKIILQILFICILAHWHNGSFAQNFNRLRISLLTCTPGEELNETFGHSALRVIDSNSVTDHVYNYGTFDFEDKNFYLKFIKGKLKYFVNIDSYNDFVFFYQQTNRGITEQVLDLSLQEKENIYHALIENVKEENKYYQYDFFLDNCTTRLRDLIEKHKQPTPLLPAVMPTSFTFRNAIHQYLDDGQKNWSKLGIDILLGAKTDAVMTVEQQKFLPDNLMKSLDANKNVQLVKSNNQLFPFEKVKAKTDIFTPLFFSILLLGLFILLSFIKNKNLKLALQILDSILFFIVGVLGLLLIFMWVGTDHSMTKNNFNLLWAWPIFIFYTFVMHKQNKIVKKFSLYAGIAFVLLLCVWFFLPQLMNNALLPIVVLLGWRAIASYYKFSK